ncbi:MAG: hypothetical protein H7336_14220 [Bacteriovorax sp.]|nr:hypothetical protein [Bacteriovorax sp.]
MDVNNQSKAIAQARDRYREAQEDLKGSYDKNLSQMQETFDGKIAKQSKNYDEHKTKLEEQNAVNNELYTDKTKTAISKGQEEFKNKLRENTAKFDQDRTGQKNELSEKLANLSDSYKKSADENNRYETQVKKSMNDRYTTANKRYQDDFNKQISNLDEKSTRVNKENREYDRDERMALQGKNSTDMENLRNSSNEQKFKEVSRLRDDNENLRTTMGRDNQNLKDRQEERVTDLFKMKNKESDDGQKNFENLQKDLRMKNVTAQEKENGTHKKESKELESRFNEDVRNIQSVANQKIKGGTNADNLNDELKQTQTSYVNRLQSARDEITRNNSMNSEKEDNIDSIYKDKLKQMKTANIEAIGKKEAEASETLKQSTYENRERNNAMIDRYKAEASSVKKEDDDHLAHTSEQGKNRIKEQRVEFGRVVNTMNDKNMETINSLKEDYSKDKTMSIEKSKKDFNEEKVALKNDFNRTVTVRDTLYEQKLAEMEKQTNKIIENYENRMAMITRKSENEIEQIKNTEMERKVKEGQANRVGVENLRAQGNAELVQMRDKYEGKIARDRAMTDNNTNKIVQKYEDQLNRERTDQQKELSVRVGESQSQFERLFKNSELEKETLRNQYEQRMENMKLGTLSTSTDPSSKKA